MSTLYAVLSGVCALMASDAVEDERAKGGEEFFIWCALALSFVALAVLETIQSN